MQTLPHLGLTIHSITFGNRIGNGSRAPIVIIMHFVLKHSVSLVAREFAPTHKEGEK